MDTLKSNLTLPLILTVVYEWEYILHMFSIEVKGWREIYTVHVGEQFKRILHMISSRCYLYQGNPLCEIIHYLSMYIPCV